ncbi:PVC-type heme-binding CxxCH protein [Urbifossiella limnaea]|uniref:Cytochrome c n=1 Tax=Urbifossiella limnaea TaxID=2528023 RepID=A0A517XV50_9BACT|nr:PVC-type heme-binding CxxCH protein [Urbifossiella limnaea]QDU21388.1 Cytochrome c [Urbifossiella limnaea]
MPRFLPAALLLLWPSAAFAQQNAKIPDPDPEVERRSFQVAEGFEVSLYAADPLLNKPIQINFDAKGRLWVASSATYPQIKPGEAANDRIIVLEDTDRDGKADKTTVFADGLLIPTGLVPGDGGVYVANSTELVHLSASQPGGKADRRKVLLSGFGTEDTHHIIHTFRWGPDSRLYFNQSIYIHSHIETPHGVRRLNAGGIWRYEPGTSQLDVFARGWVNTWGHAFDRAGQSFVTDGAGGEGINYLVVGGYYLTSQGQHVARILQGLNPGSPKFCGLEIVSGRHLPPEWQGDLITSDFRGHRVCRFKLQDDGSSYASREQEPLIRSSHPAFRPIDAKMGPDGALYIADWYNPIIQHGEVDFRDPRRDKTHGRIWRVTAKNRPLAPWPKLEGASVAELLEALKAPEDFTRQMAKRVLVERGTASVKPELQKWVSALPSDADAARLEALWVSQGLNDTDSELLSKLQKSADFRTRAAAVRVLSQVAPGATGQFAAAVADDHPRVRLEAVRGLVGAKSASAAEIALRVLDKPMDRTLDYALWLTTRELEPQWMPEFRAGKLTFGGDPKKLAFALNAVGTADAVKPVLALIEGKTVPAANRHGLWMLLARVGGPDELVKVLNFADKVENVSPTQRVELVAAVEDAIRTRRVPKPRDEVNLFHLIDEISNGTNPESRAAARSACRILALWKEQNTRPGIESIAKRETPVATADRAAAMEAVALYGDPRAKTFLASLADTGKGDARRLAIVSLASLDLPAAAGKAAAFLPTAEAKDDLLEVYGAFLNRKGGAPVLAKALAAAKLPPDVAKLGLRAVRSAVGADGAALTDALTKAGDLTAARKEPTPDDIRARVADLAAIGDASRGEAIFRRREMQCFACHAVGGAGGRVGPDLSSIGASAPADYLVESLLLPSKAIKEGFHAERVVTADEKVRVGVVVREANGMLVLRDEKDQEIAVPTRDITERGKTTKSMMPEGLIDPLTRQEVADLARFLSELGKVGPYAANPARVVRRWEIIEGTPENMNLARRTRLAAAAEAGTPFAWTPMYSKVSGVLPASELPRLVVWNGNDPLAVARFQLDVTTAGKVGLRFNSVAGLQVFVNGRAAEPAAETVLDLPAGVQTVTVVIDRAKRADDLRVELTDVPGSPARAAVVGGK